mmetsp:Transcript_82061/g.214107  ORF Transcript_82061/g.214107 Transcript_82061/m.214107 type:complete len:85 (-) Transcript_82061:2157-2411(-)
MFRQKRQSGLADHTACEPVGRMQIGVCNRQLASPPQKMALSASKRRLNEEHCIPRLHAKRLRNALLVRDFPVRLQNDEASAFCQ